MQYCPKNSPAMKEAIRKVVKKIESMSPEELKAEFEKYQPSGLAEAIERSGFFEANVLLFKEEKI